MKNLFSLIKHHYYYKNPLASEDNAHNIPSYTFHFSLHYGPFHGQHVTYHHSAPSDASAYNIASITDHDNLATGYRNIDGSDNNLLHPDWGKAGEIFLRSATSDYNDGLNTPSGDDRPSARTLSNDFFNQDISITDPSHVSAVFWLWGQFVDHDIDLTAGGGEPFHISVPTGDAYFDPFNTGNMMIPLMRSAPAAGTGSDAVPREQTNLISAFLDASVIYGSDPERTAFLRDSGGKLKVNNDNFLPYNDGSQDNASLPGMAPQDLFVAGDVRGNENAALTAMHTVFMREHNRLVDELASRHPHYSDEQLYQEARVIVEAYLQHITYDDFLPLLLGANALSVYQGYDANIDPQITNVFATAAYRFGHSMLTDTLSRLNEDGSATSLGDLALRDAFFTPEHVDSEDEISSLLRGLSADYAQAMDVSMIDEVRNFLFGPPGSGGFDLAALNIQRGRDHGLADYNTMRIAYGLTEITAFSDITTDVGLQNQLMLVYGDINNIDVFVGGLLEDPVPGSMLGELFHTAILDQFTRLRDGDRFWYENRLSDEQIDLINTTSLTDIIVRNTDIDHLPDNLFYAGHRLGGTDGRDKLNGSEEADLILGFDGHDVLKGHAGKDTLYGGDGNDKLKGGKDDDTLYGEANNDKLYGNQGDDVLHGGPGKDWLKGQQGNDELYGNDHSDILIGGTGNDLLFGGDGPDSLFGNRGNDHLTGGAGKDRLSGGKGEDTFIFNAEDGETILTYADVITDFNANTDRIDFSALNIDNTDAISINPIGFHHTSIAVNGEFFALLQYTASTEINNTHFIL